jgi:hypothetical protein
MTRPGRSVDSIRADHQAEPEAKGGMIHCTYCREVWPCDAAQLLDLLDHIGQTVVSGTEGVLGLLEEAADELGGSAPSPNTGRLVDTSRSLLNALKHRVEDIA